MVADDSFGHGNLAARISRFFNWGAVAEAIATGFSTPWRAFWAWMHSTEHCQILLDPTYDYIGVGVNPRAVRGWATGSGTWTADVALPLGWGAPSGNWGPSNGCPY